MAKKKQTTIAKNGEQEPRDTRGKKQKTRNPQSNRNKKGTSKVGAKSQAQKAQNFQKCKKGDSLASLRIHFVPKYQKNEGATLWRQ